MPLAFLTGLVWDLPVYIVFIIINAEDCVKFLPYLIRFKSKKWIKNLTN